MSNCPSIARPRRVATCPLVELKDVGKSYGNIIALKDINLRVGPVR